MEEGENHVLFAQELNGADSPFGVSVKIGLRITWVNLNRLIIDIFATPAEAAAINIEGNISIDSSGKAFGICTFCPSFYGFLPKRDGCGRIGLQGHGLRASLLRNADILKSQRRDKAYDRAGRRQKPAEAVSIFHL